MNRSELDTSIAQRQLVLEKVKSGLIERLNLYQNVKQIDDDTPLFGSGLKLDSVDATEVIVLLDESFGIRIQEGDDPSWMRSINTLTSFIITRQNAMSDNASTETKTVAEQGA